jgi:hypothetical protein
MMGNHEFKVGDVVYAHVNGPTRWAGRRYFHGTLTRLDDLSATVKPDDGSRSVVIRRRNQLHDWSFDIVSEQAYTRVLWLRREPKCEALRATMSKERGLSITAQFGRDIPKIQQARNELLMLSAWLAEEPPTP